mgnify:CR=1 FL=1
MQNLLPPILDVGGVLVSSEIITERFCCDLEVCKGCCCVEGDAGAPVTLEEIAEIEDALDIVWSDMNASAQAVVDKQGVAYTDQEGDLVTSIVGGKDCVFTYYDDLGEVKNCCLCALEKAFRAGRSRFCKPISCALYPIREKRFSGGLILKVASDLLGRGVRGNELRILLLQVGQLPHHHVVFVVTDDGSIVDIVPAAVLPKGGLQVFYSSKSAFPVHFSLKKSSSHVARQQSGDTGYNSPALKGHILTKLRNFRMKDGKRQDKIMP